MPSSADTAYELFQAAVGKPEGAGDWFEVGQDRIDAFAEVTEDRQFIHVDPDKAARLSPWGVTVAHGFLTLSLLSHLATSLPQDPARLSGLVMGVNYGFEKVRFVAPVKVGAKVRVSSVLAAAERKGPDAVQITRTMTIEIEGEDKPAVVADWLTRLVYR